MKRMMSLLLVFILMFTLFACSSSNQPTDVQETKTPEETQTPEPTGNNEEAPDQKTNEMTGTLRFVGPGLFAGVGPDGTEDLVTGEKRPGYNVLIEDFNKDYPNVEVKIDAIPWDNWMSVVQTAAAGGTADILLHGSMLAEVCIDLTPYLEADPEVYEALAIKPEVFRPDVENYNKTAPTGISYRVSPYYALIDKQLFEEWGVEIPDANWTYDDLLNIARQMTGKNPVTGQENYGVWYFGNDDGNIWKIFSTIAAAWGVKTMVFDKPNKFEAAMNFNTPEAVRVFEYIGELYKCTPPTYLENLGSDKIGTPENNIAIFISEGPLGMYRTTLHYGTEDRYAYLPLPVNEVDVEAKSSSFTGTNSIAISKNAADPDLAWEFIKWLVLDEEANKWVLDTGNVPATYYGLSQLDPELPYTKCINEIFSSFWEQFTVSQTEAFDTAYGNALAALSGGLTGMYNGTYTPQEAAEYVQSQIVEYQNMYK